MLEYIQPPFSPEDVLPENSPVRVISLETGTVQPVARDAYVTGAGLAYIVHNPPQPKLNGIYLAVAPGETGRLVRAGAFAVPTNRHFQTLNWAANNVLLAGSASGTSIVIMQPGTG